MADRERRGPSKLAGKGAGKIANTIYDAAMKPFEEIVKFIADAAGPEKLNSFRPSPAAEKRVAELLVRQKEGSLRPKEEEELQLFVQLDHVMSLAKARSRLRRRASAA